MHWQWLAPQPKQRKTRKGWSELHTPLQATKAHLPAVLPGRRQRAISHGQQNDTIESITTHKEVVLQTCMYSTPSPPPPDSTAGIPTALPTALVTHTRLPGTLPPPQSSTRRPHASRLTPHASRLTPRAHPVNRVPQLLERDEDEDRRRLQPRPRRQPALEHEHRALVPHRRPDHLQCRLVGREGEGEEEGEEGSAAAGRGWGSQRVGAGESADQRVRSGIAKGGHTHASLCARGAHDPALERRASDTRSRRRSALLTLITSAGEHTVVATVPCRRASAQ